MTNIRLSNMDILIRLTRTRRVKCPARARCRAVMIITILYCGTCRDLSALTPMQSKGICINLKITINAASGAIRIWLMPDTKTATTVSLSPIISNHVVDLNDLYNCMWRPEHVALSSSHMVYSHKPLLIFNTLPTTRESLHARQPQRPTSQFYDNRDICMEEYARS